MGKSLNRTAFAVKSMCRKLGLKNLDEKVVWTKEMEQFLVSNYRNMDRNEISAALGIPPASISTKAHRLGVGKGPARLFSKEMDNILRKEYPVKSRNELSVILGVTPSQITSRAAYMGLKKRQLKTG